MKNKHAALLLIMLMSLSIIASCESDISKLFGKQAKPPKYPSSKKELQQTAAKPQQTAATPQPKPSTPTTTYPEKKTTTPTSTPTYKKPYEEEYGRQTTIGKETTQETEQTPTSQASRTTQQTTPSTATTSAPSSSTPIKRGIYRDYAYLLQNANLNALLAQPRDIYIVDIDDAKLTPAEISELHNRGSTVVSYLSIGEAEDYRNYWQEGWALGNPDFLDEENPDWQGNFKVKYWDPQWQSIILANLDKIVNAGYDGVYLDIIDGYEYYKDKGVADADRRMIDWVKKISARAKSKNPNFLVIPQNSPELAVHMDYLAAIDGLGKETTWYEAEEKIPEDWTAEAVLYLDGAVANGKFILAIDYPTDTAKRCDFISKARAHSFVPTVGPRALDKIEDYPTC